MNIPHGDRSRGSVEADTDGDAERGASTADASDADEDTAGALVSDAEGAPPEAARG
jgi:hypothetical protein